MATAPKDSNTPAAPAKDNAPPVPAKTAAQVQGDAPTIGERAEEMVGYREGQIGAKEASLEAAAQAKKEEEAGIKAAVAAENSAFVPNYMGQVPQEGALVETPPQPVPPPHTEAELKEMDHSPLGYREPSVAAGASGFDDYDLTVHPKSRVDDPSKPL